MKSFRTAYLRRVIIWSFITLSIFLSTGDDGFILAEEKIPPATNKFDQKN